MIHDSGQIGVRKCDAAVGVLPQRISRAGLSCRPEEESGLWTEISVAPPVQDDTGYIAIGIETRAPEHGCELVANHAFIVPERGAQQLHTSPRGLLLKTQSRLGKKNLQSEHGRQVGINLLRISAERRHLPERD